MLQSNCLKLLISNAELYGSFSFPSYCSDSKTVSEPKCGGKVDCITRLKGIGLHKSGKVNHCREIQFKFVQTEEPVALKYITQPCEFPPVDFLIPELASEGGMNFGKANNRRKDYFTTVKSVSDSLAPSLIEISLCESRGIQVKHYSRSSNIICEAGFPLVGIGLNFLKGRVPRRKWPSASSLRKTSIVLERPS